MTTGQKQMIGDKESRQMIEFASQWALYGGGSSDDIFVKFGVSSKVFFQRLSWMIESGGTVDPDERRTLRELCDKRMRG
ncbi:hypothetical protein ABIE52_000192 [Rhodococcus sp. OAS809]|uniref:hypothetical protein n=1 Tax=Rhodococcus sp. OAS809 TaxID=2663874 RepID=UPI0017893CBA